MVDFVISAANSHCRWKNRKKALFFKFRKARKSIVYPLAKWRKLFKQIYCYQ